jgi:hypothetical protein
MNTFFMNCFSRRVLRVLLLCGAASFGIYGGASCGAGSSEATGSTSSSGGTGGAAPRADLVFDGDANATALAALTAVQGPVNPATYAIFDLPAEGAVYDRDFVPKFTWHMNAQPGPPPDGGTDSGAFLLRGAPAARRASLGPLLDLFGKERFAAAGDPVNGLGYLLLFQSKSDSDLLRVFTTKTSYTPAGGALEILRGAGEQIQVWILTGVFDNDALTSYGGPFKGPWTSFEINP